MKQTILIPAQIIRSNHMVTFGIGEGDRAGQTFRGATKGLEQVGDVIRTRKQVDADRYEYSTVTVIGREDRVTGDVVLTVEDVNP